MKTKKDNRDPSALGAKLLDSAQQVRAAYGKNKKKIPLSEIWDIHTSQFILPEMEDSPSSIDRYGRPDELVPCYAEIRIR